MRQMDACARCLYTVCPGGPSAVAVSPQTAAPHPTGRMLCFPQLRQGKRGDVVFEGGVEHAVHWQS